MRETRRLEVKLFEDGLDAFVLSNINLRGAVRARGLATLNEESFEAAARCLNRCRAASRACANYDQIIMNG